jgi:hypothetical protein
MEPVAIKLAVLIHRTVRLVLNDDHGGGLVAEQQDVHPTLFCGDCPRSGSGRDAEEFEEGIQKHSTLAMASIRVEQLAQNATVIGLLDRDVAQGIEEMVLIQIALALISPDNAP